MKMFIYNESNSVYIKTLDENLIILFFDNYDHKEDWVLEIENKYFCPEKNICWVIPKNKKYFWKKGKCKNKLFLTIKIKNK